MISRLVIETLRKNGVTILKKCYCTQPFKIAIIKDIKGQNYLNLILMTSSPGILDGDVYDLNICLGPNSCLQLETQSFQRLFQMESGASQNLKIVMDEGSSFFYIPHPVVPHMGSKFAATIQIYLSQHCNLLLSEIVTSGRKLNGENFHFSSYQNLTEIYLNNQLIIKENMLMVPSEGNVHSLGLLEGFTHQASIICILSNRLEESTVRWINCYLDEEDEIIFGTSRLPVNGLVVRLLGNSADQLFTCIKAISCFIFSNIVMPTKELEII